MRMYGYGNLLVTMSLRNPQLTRHIFSQIMERRVDSTSKNVKKTLSDYDKELSSAVNDVDKKLLTNRLTSTPLYTGKSSIQANYYSTIGGLFNYLL